MSDHNPVISSGDDNGACVCVGSNGSGGCRCVGGSEALSADMDAEEEGGSEVDMMLGLGLDISIIELF